jgi:uncharacterized protein YdaU (DUF1376 family)
MSKVDIWMPLYIGDYLSDTMRLTTEQHGAYLLLLMEHWIAESLPDDEEELSLIARMSIERWRECWVKLEKFFTKKGGKLYNNRVVSEIEKAKSRRDSASENGKKGGRPRKNDNPEKTHGFPEGKPTDNPDHNPQESSSPSPSPSSLSLQSSPPAPAQTLPPCQEGIGTNLPTEYIRVDEKTGEILEMGGLQ